MIRVTVHGRLGNQMFQYAAAYELAKRRRTSLCVDTSYFWSPNNFSDYELWRFEQLALRRLTLPEACARRALQKLRLVRPPRPSFEMLGLGINPSVLELPDGTHLNGYFQSVRYFENSVDDIRAHFDLTPFLPTRGRAFIEAQRAKGPVISLHVRRGDYTNISQFDIGAMSFYEKAIEHVASRARGDFLIFSDDIPWCRRQPLFSGDNMRFADEIGLDGALPIHEMAVMSSCDHHIIANSTFAWWSAFLGASPRKMVVMPKQWLANYTTNECGLSVGGWVQL